MLKCAALVSCLLLWASAARAQEPEQWLITVDLWGNPSYQVLSLNRRGSELTGNLDGDSLVGERTQNALHFKVTDNQHLVYEFFGTESGAKISGKAEYPGTNEPQARVTHAFNARRLPVRPAGPARTHEFKPTVYSNEFSAHREPVLTIWPGDSVHTTTIDSGGVDEQGITRALFGNPQTGPFYVATAAPGDTLIIRIRRLRLNRDYADSLDKIVGRALSLSLAAKSAELGKPVRWKLDRQRGIAKLETPSARLRNFTVPLKPMLGGLAVAPGFGSPPSSTGDTGQFGGNMDFNEVVEGNTVYLPVFQPGALLYLGDAHALQGDGETSQYALETSMDVTFTVEIQKAKSIPLPRVESATHLMALGQAGSLDDALRSATSGLIQWLEQDYGLDLSQSAQILGSSVQYVVANLAGRSVGIVAKLEKSRLATLKR